MAQDVGLEFKPPYCHKKKRWEKKELHLRTERASRKVNCVHLPCVMHSDWYNKSFNPSATHLTTLRHIISTPCKDANIEVQRE
jgi:hypothetical protein